MTMPTEQIRLLKEFTQLCQANPDVLHLPELQFYRDWLKSLGATLPAKQAQAPKQEPKPEPAPEPKVEEPEEEEEEEVESDIELDESGVMQDDDNEPPEYADENTEVTEEMIDMANDKRNDAIDAANEGRADGPPGQQLPLPQIRKSYTIAEKISTVMWFRSNGRNLSECQRKFGISRKSLRTWDKEYERLLEHSANNKMMMKKIGTGAEPLSHKLDEDMFQWYTHMKTTGVCLTNCVLMDQARLIAKGLNIKKFQGSYGWLRRWKMRFKIDGSDHVNRRKNDQDGAGMSMHVGYNYEHSGENYLNAASQGMGCGGPVFPGIYNSYQVYGTVPSISERECSSELEARTHVGNPCTKTDSTRGDIIMESDVDVENNKLAQSASHETSSGLSDDVIKEISVRKGCGLSTVELDQGSDTALRNTQNSSEVGQEQCPESPPQFKVYLNTDTEKEIS